jgi:hypothetical protein
MIADLSRMRSGMALLVAALVTAGGSARADGFYYQQSYGISSARGKDAGVLGESLQLRIGLGWRFGALQVGPTFYGHLAVQRDGAYLGLLGGDPERGDSDLEVIGADARYNARFHRNISVYMRGGPRYARGTAGVLDDATGPGLGAGTGVAITGKVRALGFLFLPMFWSKRGPMITATLFIDHNVEWYRMRGDTISLPIVGTSIGFGAGSFF